jgi:hypothetical protein
MLRLLPIALLAIGGLRADQKDAARPLVPRGIPKAGKAPRQPQMGPPLSNPGSPAARLYRATPEERDRALEKLPPKLAEQIRKQLDIFDKMPKPQQQVMIRRAERFAALSVEQKATFAQQMKALGQLEPERRREIGLALRRLQPLGDDDRRKWIGSEAFQSRFSADEQKIITGLAEVMIPSNQ